LQFLLFEFANQDIARFRIGGLIVDPDRFTISIHQIEVSNTHVAFSDDKHAVVMTMIEQTDHGAGFHPDLIHQYRRKVETHVHLDSFAGCKHQSPMRVIAMDQPSPDPAFRTRRRSITTPGSL